MQIFYLKNLLNLKILFLLSINIFSNNKNKEFDNLINFKISFDNKNENNINENNIFLDQNLNLKFKNNYEYNDFPYNSESDQELYLKELLSTRANKPKNNIFDGIDYEKITMHKQENKQWTILIYIAGDNDLYRFALRNIEQLKKIGSNGILNILIHFDFHIDGKPKETRRFYVQRDKLIQVGNYPAMDSGSEKTLIDACEWAITNYPSKHFSLVLWNHGSGSLNPIRIRQLSNSSELFFYNPTSRKIELDRTINYIDYLTKVAKERGICFDDTTGHYLDDIKLQKAFSYIKNLRNGKKIDVLLMDACLMAGVETAFLCCDYADYLTCSEEVVLGPGYNYAMMLSPLAKRILSPCEFALHIVNAFKNTYSAVSNDYTQSCIKLENIKNLADSINKFAELILYFSEFDKQNLIKKTVKVCANKNLVTHFSEPSYIDLKHFLENMKNNSIKINIKDYNNNFFYDKLIIIIYEILDLLDKSILINVSGKNLPKAYGLSIYLPSENIHPSFNQTIFGSENSWFKMLKFICKDYTFATNSNFDQNIFNPNNFK